MYHPLSLQCSYNMLTIRWAFLEKNIGVEDGISESKVSESMKNLIIFRPSRENDLASLASRSALLTIRPPRHLLWEKPKTLYT